MANRFGWLAGTTGVPAVLPPLVQAPSPNQSPRLHGATVVGLVVHRPVGSYAGAIATMRDPKHEAAAHAIVRDDGRQATQLVPWNRKAWHAAAFNSYTIGVETPDAVWLEQVGRPSYAKRVCARVFAYLAHKHAIPARAVTGADLIAGKRGLVRHLDLGAMGGGHTDPTSREDVWHEFVELVAHELDRGGFRPSWGVA